MNKGVQREVTKGERTVCTEDRETLENYRGKKILRVNLQLFGNCTLTRTVIGRQRTKRKSVGKCCLPMFHLEDGRLSRDDAAKSRTDPQLLTLRHDQRSLAANLSRERGRRLGAGLLPPDRKAKRKSKWNGRWLHLIEFLSSRSSARPELRKLRRRERERETVSRGRVIYLSMDGGTDES